MFSDVRLLHDLAHGTHFSMLNIHPPDYCVTGDGLDAKAATSVNECYITGEENWALVQSYVQPCYSPTGSLATMEPCSRRNEFEGSFARTWA